MKNTQNYRLGASFALLFFIMLGYVVKFYPETLTNLDSTIQASIRGDLPTWATNFYRAITVLGNTPIIFGYSLGLTAIFYYIKQWKAESLYLVANLGILGILSTTFKIIYNRPRPDLAYLIDKPLGASYPSWHAASSFIVMMTLVIIIGQRLKTTWLRWLLQAVLVLVLLGIGISRLYLGVHYPTDILGGWLLAAAILLGLFPFYDKLRFQWRFKSKQK